MTPVFLDTSFLIALTAADDAHHSVALVWQRAVKAPLLTTEYVLLEFLDALVSETGRQLAASSVEAMRRHSGITIVAASTPLFDAGLALYSQRIDKIWGITDCISFVVMHQHQITDALTSDHHFEQAGFTSLLRHNPPS